METHSKFKNSALRLYNDTSVNGDTVANFVDFYNILYVPNTQVQLYKNLLRDDNEPMRHFAKHTSRDVVRSLRNQRLGHYKLKKYFEINDGTLYGSNTWYMYHISPHETYLLNLYGQL